MIIEEIDDDSDSQPCQVCGDNDNEEVLLLCDGCDVPSHTYCIGLDTLPTGGWYCDQCEAQRAIGSVSDSSTRPARRRPERRTRAQQRILRSRNQANSFHWARVWQSVWDRLNLDLDFPFDDEAAADRILQHRRREASNQREFRVWQRRFHVAERQSAGSGFRDPASILDNYAPRPSRPRVPRAPTPEPESMEEMRAWNAFERARELENNPNTALKRKSPTLSPSPEPTEPERKLKRPRTRRAGELAAIDLSD
jgi:PHD-finger